MAKTEDNGAKGGRGKTLALGIGLPLALAAGGFYAAYEGFVPAPSEWFAGADEVAADPESAPSFVPLDPMIVTINSTGASQQLRFEGQLEVAPENAAAVADLMPRVMDTLNTYLRAVELTDIRDPAALLRLRAQMLRRIQIVTGEGRVDDLLVTKFLVS